MSKRVDQMTPAELDAAFKRAVLAARSGANVLGPLGLNALAAERNRRRCRGNNAMLITECRDGMVRHEGVTATKRKRNT